MHKHLPTSVYIMLLPVYVCVSSTQGDQKRPLDSLKLESHMVVSCHGVLETNPGSSTKEKSALNYSAISLEPSQ